MGARSVCHGRLLSQLPRVWPFFQRTQQRGISHVVRQPVECRTVTVVMEERPSRTTRPTLLRMKAVVVMQKTAIWVVARWQFSS
jgi:hypothetical protein